MAIKTSTTWESVTTDGNFTTKRLKVIGGWIVRIEENSTYNTFSTILVNDPNFEWESTNTDDD